MQNTTPEIPPIVTTMDERFPLLQSPSVMCAFPPDDEDRAIIQRMVDILNAPKINGIGLSAVQIGIPKRIFVIKGNIILKQDSEGGWYEEPEYLAFVNPTIVSQSKDCNTKTESCLSLPGIQARIRRPKSLILQYCTIDGVPCEEEYMGSVARIICHEMDHLNGKLITDHLESQLSKQAKINNKKTRINRARKEKRRKLKKQRR